MSGSAFGERSEVSACRARERSTRPAAEDSVLSNMILTARLITAAALMRKESRGGHYRVDYPTSQSGTSQRTFITIDDLNAS